MAFLHCTVTDNHHLVQQFTFRQFHINHTAAINLNSLLPITYIREIQRLTVKGMDFIMGGRRRFYGGIALARVAEHLPHAVLNNRFNPWSAPGRDMPPFAPKTFNALWKRGEVKSGKTSKDE